MNTPALVIEQRNQCVCELGVMEMSHTCIGQDPEMEEADKQHELWVLYMFWELHAV